MTGWDVLAVLALLALTSVVVVAVLSVLTDPAPEPWEEEADPEWLASLAETDGGEDDPRDAETGWGWDR